MEHSAGNLSHTKIAQRGTRDRHFSREQVVAMAAQSNNRSGKRKPKKNDFFCLVRDAFRVIAQRTSSVLGSAWAFMIALGVIVIWGLSGHIFHYSDTWQLIINTGTTIVTFLMVFLIQNTQNRDSRAIQLKLDEIIRSLEGARNKMMDLEKLSDEDLDKFQKEFERLRKRAERTAEKVETKIDQTVASR
jgi:low affinity Fe/Cu permease